jgi:uncharacterized alkaline shock family protein YloU
VAGATDPSGVPGGRGEINRDVLARSVRSAAAECYGVTAVGATRWRRRLAGWLRPHAPSGVTVAVDGRLRVTLDLSVAAHVPLVQVVANVGQAVRYRVLRDFGRSIDELTIRVDGRPVEEPPSPPATDAPR